MIDRLPFLANVVILVPVCWAMFFADNQFGVAAFEGRVADSAPLRLMVASFWLAILVLSVAALFNPAPFAAVLAIQILYKAVWLIAFAWPAWRAGIALPMGVTVSFLIIVTLWPVFLWRAWA